MDTPGCGLDALGYPDCAKLLGPLVPGTAVPHGAKVPGTSFQLDPVQATFTLGTMIRWLDYTIRGWPRKPAIRRIILPASSQPPIT